MKKWIALLLFGAGLSLPAQANPNFFMYIHGVTGKSSSPSDNETIEQMLVDEAIDRQAGVILFPAGADFSLITSLTPLATRIPEINENDILRYSNMLFQEGWTFVPGEQQESSPMPANTYFYEASHDKAVDQLYVFTITAQNAKTDTLLVEQTLIYATIDDIINYFPLLMFNIYSRIIKTPERKDPGLWRENWLFMSFTMLWSPRTYYGTERSTYLVNFGGASSVEFHFAKYFSGEIGIVLISDWVQVLPTDYYQDLILEIPLLIKLVLKPFDHFMLEPYGGFQLNVSLFGTTVPPLFSWTAGFQYGVRAGPGAIVADTRISGDFGRGGLVMGGNIDKDRYQRSLIHIGLGYKVGVQSKQ